MQRLMKKWLTWLTKYTHKNIICVYTDTVEQQGRVVSDLGAANIN